MAVEVTMPQLSDTMDQGTIVNWKVDEGDFVNRGDIIGEIETDKATMDLEAFDEGTILKKLYEEGDEVPTQSLIAVIGEEGEDISDLVQEAKSSESDDTEEEGSDESGDDERGSEDQEPNSTDEEEKETKDRGSDDISNNKQPVSDTEAEDSEEPQSETDGAGRLRISPVAQRMAAQYNVNVNALQGSGPQGRIIKKDVEEAIQESTKPQISKSEVSGGDLRKESQLTEQKQDLSGMRQTIAQRMSEAFRDVPHFYLEQEIKANSMMNLLEDLNENDSESEFTLNDLILAATARALTEHPQMNSSFEGDHILLHDSVDLAFAVAVEEGLFTPVIPSAETLGLRALHDKTESFVKKARNGNLTPDDYKGGTFTVSNLGMFDIPKFSAILNPPQAGLLAVGKVDEKPVVQNNQITIGKRMQVTLSCDHRSVDGAIGARFLRTFKRFLENPYNIFV